LIGKNCVLDLTGTAAAGTATYTIVDGHNAANGCTIMPLDIKKYPGKVRFSIRPAATTQGWATGIS
jgi:alkaline phosphatase